jgi:hypothetical protein
MKALEFLISAKGLNIWPPNVPGLNNDTQTFNTPGLNVITLTFFNNIQTTTNQFTGQVTNIVPTNPVTTGLSGTIIVLARPTPNSPWLNIEANVLDISLNSVMLNAVGLISGVSLSPGSVTGCNYILCQLTRGA